MARTGIICTLGPACDSPSVLKKMIQAGMSIARLNFSHGDPREHLRRLRMIRSLSRQLNKRVKILQDLEGYRIRTGRLKGPKPVELKKGAFVTLTNKDIPGDSRAISFDYKGRLSDIKKGAHIYIDDGNMLLLVKGRSGSGLKAQVQIGGMLKEHKGINMPDVILNFKGLTDKDKKDLEFGIEHRVDYVAQSFVRDRDDILALRALLGSRLKGAGIIAKIENRQGIKNLDRIMDVCDGIMIARGDMGVSVPIYEIPMIQKMMIKKCNERKKMVITATQMLESMTENIRPTRAEVTDVSNAVLEGTGFVMLSAETAVGLHPVETVRLMNQIIGFTERFTR